MRNQMMGLRILFAMILFFQAETSQARTVQECSHCTSKSCLDADDKEWCVKNCSLDAIPDCLKVSPKLKNASDANRHGDIRRAEMMGKIYKKFPLSKYFLDFNAPEELGRERDQPLNDEEKTQIKDALQELEKGCQEIANRLEYAKGEKISAKDLLGSLEQIRDSLQKTKTDFSNINKNLSIAGLKQDIAPEKLTSSNLTSTSTRFDVKVAFEKANINLKTCFNQGEGAIFKAEQKGSFVDKAIAKFNCSISCSAKECKKSSKAYDKCLKNCPASQIESCIEAVSQASSVVGSKKNDG